MLNGARITVTYEDGNTYSRAHRLTSLVMRLLFSPPRENVPRKKGSDIARSCPSKDLDKSVSKFLTQEFVYFNLLNVTLEKNDIIAKIIYIKFTCLCA